MANLPTRREPIFHPGYSRMMRIVSGNPTKENLMPSSAYRKAQQTNTNRIRLIAGIVLVLVVIGILYLLNLHNLYPPPDYPFTPREAGNPSAKIVLEEFADYQCPYCGVFATTVQPVLFQKYVNTGKIRFVFRNFAFVDGSDPNQESHMAAIAALCAGDQEQFWPYHDIVMSHQTGENVGDFLRPKLTAFALPLNLDTAKFDQCLSSNKFADLMKSDGERALQFGVNSTPSFFINEKAVMISSNFQTDLFNALDIALREAGVQ
jgi:protein-disulfide isomerase